jgi:tetratricopeptide (TPR) repeat protein
MNRWASRSEPQLRDARAALDLARQTTSTDGDRVLEAVRDLGVAYLRDGDLVRARDLLASVVAAQSGPPEVWAHVAADAGHRLGHVLYRLGELEPARDVQQQVLDYFHHDGGDGAVAGLYNLVFTMNALGAYPELHRLGVDIIDARLERMGPDSKKTICYLETIAHMWAFLGDYQRSARIYRRIIPQEIQRISPPLVTIKSIAVFVFFVLPGKLLMRLDANFDPSRRWRRELAKREDPSGKHRWNP